MNSTFDNDDSWYKEGKKSLKDDYELGLLTKIQYIEKLNQLDREKREDSFY